MIVMDMFNGTGHFLLDSYLHTVFSHFFGAFYESFHLDWLVIRKFCLYLHHRLVSHYEKDIFLLMALIVMGTAQKSMAQNVELNDQTQFVVAKGKGSVNIRKSPNAKAAKADALGEDETLPVIKEQNGWYQVLLTDGKTGWVNKTVCRVSTAQLNVSQICDHVFGVSDSYDDWRMWTVGKVEGTDMYVAIDEFALWLGKKVGNHLVFDQCVSFTTSYDPDRKELLVEPPVSIEDGYRVYYGDANAMPDNQEGKAFRPSSLTKQDIKRLFNGRQQKGRYRFFGPELFAKKYRDVIFG